MVGPLLTALAVALVAAPVASVLQGRREALVEEFTEERTRVFAHAGQRHLEFGIELRDKGLTTQAAAQILLAVEVARGVNPGAQMVLGLMRQYEGAFWKRKIARPTPAKLEAYEKKARKLRQEDHQAQQDLVRWAQRKGLDEQAFTELRELLLELDEPLAFDEKGALSIEGTSFGGELSARIRAEAIEINGLPYARDTFLQRLPDLARIFEKSSPALRVRSTTSLEEAAELHATAGALLPFLLEDLGAKPERRLQLVALGERSVFEAYLTATGLASHRAADGFADRVAGTAVLCGAGSTHEFVLGLALHELTHLYQLSVSPAVFPSWFAEGKAESYGGEGTFRWDGAKLETGGAMAAPRLADLRSAPLPLRELLAGDALALLAKDRTAARRFYAESWAFLRFLEHGAGEDAAERLERWRTMCLGSAAGADFEKPYGTDAGASQELFLQLFEKDLDRLEREFGVWLAAQ